jgi:Xaa-Pro aminopeptidase
VSRHAHFPYSAADLDRFRQVQRLAYDIALDVEAQLRIGMTETEVCTLMGVAQRGHGADQVFHEPFAWFGRRTLLGPDWVAAGSGVPQPADTVATTAATPPASGFFPTETALSYGMPLILDLAPTLGGFSADIGYSCTVGANPVFEELDRELSRIRTFLLDGVRAGMTLRAIYLALDERLDEHGTLSCYRHYPEAALGHVLFPLEVDPPRPTPIRGFGTAAAEGLVAASQGALEGGTGYPIWNDRSLADRPPTPGLWAVEPHIGRDGVGVKFEELLVVTEDDAYWLDDHLPHCQRWAAAGYSTEVCAPR